MANIRRSYLHSLELPFGGYTSGSVGLWRGWEVELLSVEQEMVKVAIVELLGYVIDQWQAEQESNRHLSVYCQDNYRVYVLSSCEHLGVHRLAQKKVAQSGEIFFPKSMAQLDFAV